MRRSRDLTDLLLVTFARMFGVAVMLGGTVGAIVASVAAFPVGLIAWGGWLFAMMLGLLYFRVG